MPLHRNIASDGMNPKYSDEAKSINVLNHTRIVHIKNVIGWGYDRHLQISMKYGKFPHTTRNVLVIANISSVDIGYFLI